MIIPYDTARCMTPCSLAPICRRREPGNELMQVFGSFPGGPGCVGLIERKEEP